MTSWAHVSASPPSFLLLPRVAKPETNSMATESRSSRDLACGDGNRPYKARGHLRILFSPPARLESSDCGHCRSFGSRGEAGKAAAVKSFLGCRVSEFKDLPSFGSRLRRCLAPSLALYCVLTILPRCRTHAGSHQPPFSIAGPFPSFSATPKAAG